MQTSERSPIICLMGPTASGKTQLAVELVKHFSCEIISVDSAMVYRGMDIGTAKPTAEILQQAPHRLINLLDPTEAYSAAQFCEDALREIKDIVAHQKIPLLVGGTMLYFRALQQGLADLPSADPAVRASLFAAGELQGWPALHERLQKIDPQAAARIHPHDAQRIQRALEVYEITGINLTTWQAKQTAQSIASHYQVFNIALAPQDRAILHARIRQRFDDMLAQGFVDEVKHLFERGDLSLALPAMRAVGYRQVWEYLLGVSSYEEMREKGVIATRQLAKRQLTWLRSWSEVKWFDSESQGLVGEVLDYLGSEEREPP